MVVLAVDGMSGPRLAGIGRARKSATAQRSTVMASVASASSSSSWSCAPPEGHLLDQLDLGREEPLRSRRGGCAEWPRGTAARRTGWRSGRAHALRGSGIVSVTMTSLSRRPRSARWQHRTRRGWRTSRPLARRPRCRRVDGLDQGAGGVDLVVDDDRRLALDLTDDVLQLAQSSFPVRRFSTMASGASSFSAKLRAFLAKIELAHHDQVLQVDVLQIDDVAGQHVDRGQLVDRDREEATDLTRCRSMVRTRSAPATVSMSATSRAVIGTRGWSFLSERPYA